MQVDELITIPLAAYGHRTDLNRLRFKWLNPERNDEPEFYDLEKWFSNAGYVSSDIIIPPRQESATPCDSWWCCICMYHKPMWSGFKLTDINHQVLYPSMCTQQCVCTHQYTHQCTHQCVPINVLYLIYGFSSIFKLCAPAISGSSHCRSYNLHKLLLQK